MTKAEHLEERLALARERERLAYADLARLRNMIELYFEPKKDAGR